MPEKSKEKQLVEKFYKDQGVDIETFLSNDLSLLPDFSTLLDINKAAKRITKSIKSGKKIGIYGDYDADGTTSLALFYSFLSKFCGSYSKIDKFSAHKKFNAHEMIETYQPNRFVDGYGLHKSSVKKALEDKVDVLVTFDCGIMNQESALYAKECGLDLIITDHHNDGGAELPVAYAVVNPKRQDQKGDPELKNLAGVGVAFALALEVKKELGITESVYELLQFVAIGTIGDLVELSPMNAKMVRHGLRQFKKSSFPAIKKLGHLAPINGLNSEYIAFRVAPMINSKGRLGDPSDALRFLISDSERDAHDYYHKIKDSNEKRKVIQASAKEESVKLVESGENCTPLNSGVLSVFSEVFNEGVVGLVASSLMRKYAKPTICLTESSKDESVIKGSTRSFGDFNIYNFLNDLDFDFLSFGGHSKAAGLSFKKDKLDDFLKAVENESKDLKVKEVAKPTIKAGEEGASWRMFSEISSFEPFGQGNPKPLVECEVSVERAYLMKEKHLCIMTSKGKKFVMFNCFDAAKKDVIEEVIDKRPRSLKVSFKINAGEYMGEPQLSLFIENIKL